METMMKAKGRQARNSRDVDATRPLHLVYGSDEYVVSSHARKIADTLCPESERVLGMEIIEGQTSNAGEAVDALNAEDSAEASASGHPAVSLREHSLETLELLESASRIQRAVISRVAREAQNRLSGAPDCTEDADADQPADDVPATPRR